MATILSVWLLVATNSNGGVTTIAQIATQADCEVTRAALKDATPYWLKAYCVPAKVVAHD